MSKLRLLGLMGLLALGSIGCSSKNKAKLNGDNYPKHHYLAIGPSNMESILSMDLDGDKIADEVIKFNDLNLGAAHTGLSAANLVIENYKDNWKHLVAKGYEGKTYVQTDDFQELKPQERADFSTLYKTFKEK